MLFIATHRYAAIPNLFRFWFLSILPHHQHGTAQQKPKHNVEKENAKESKKVKIKTENLFYGLHWVEDKF